jgi:hypothetical protein
VTEIYDEVGITGRSQLVKRPYMLHEGVRTYRQGKLSKTCRMGNDMIRFLLRKNSFRKLSKRQIHDWSQGDPSEILCSWFLASATNSGSK